MRWWGDGRLGQPTLENRGYNWSHDTANELGTLEILNSEAECLEKMVVTVHAHAYPESKWERELIQERLDELREVKSGVFLVAGKVQHHGIPDEEIDKMVEEYVRKLNAERASE